MKKVTEDQLWDSYNNLLLSSDIDRVRKLLCRYELFKRSLPLPGDIVECGVFKGAGWMYWLKLLRLFAEGEQKRVVGFDTFGNFADSLLDYEKESAKSFVNEASFEGIDPLLLESSAKQFGFNNCELVSGDVIETIPEYAKNNPGFRISLLNLDFDTYKGTKVALEVLYDYITPGGIVVLDEYGKRGWGESDAVDEFLKGKKIELQAIRQSFQPTAYFIKPLL